MFYRQTDNKNQKSKMSPMKKKHMRKHVSLRQKSFDRSLLTKRLQRNATDLEYLARAQSAVRARKINGASEDLILAIVDVAKALIRGKISLTGGQLKAARARKTELQKLARKNVTTRTKRVLLEQRGDLLGVVLGPLIKGLAGPLIGSLLGGLGGGR